MLYLAGNQLTVKAARPPKSGVLTYKFCVIAVQLIFLCVYIDLWNFEVSSSILTHNENFMGAICFRLPCILR
ncbi:hypothetical protein SAMN02744124_01500 [Paenibacillus barengoltzii J12]|uniref:Uncharacterized protein n=1 Tax=Paenibacillus barengoltzii J12 TaxID=935846 RepID=A0ABY1LYL9_9BACL|nr:hypothetical protein SAMN02744124_01500 [Paenibacillus barengoltzii J12]